MKIPFNDLSRYDSGLIKAAISRVVDRGWYLNGVETEAFEKEFAEFNELPSVVACSSGTDALEIALRVWRIGPGDEVIVPANTWVSDAEIVVRVGAHPVFVDVKMDTGEIDLEHLASCRTEKSRVLICVHLYGNHQQIRPLRTILGPNVKILEDYAHRVGVPVAKRGNDAFGDAIAFSFYPTKNLGATGDAGAVASFDEEFTQKARLLRDHGQPSRDVHLAVGSTNRIDEIHAAVLREKLVTLSKDILRRRQIALQYWEAIEDSQNLTAAFKWQDEGANHLFVVLSDDRDRFVAYLDQHGIAHGSHYPHALSDLEIFPSSSCKNASYRAAQMVSLPMYPQLTEEEVAYIAEKLRRF